MITGKALTIEEISKEVLNRDPAEMARILNLLPSSNEKILELAKDVATFTYDQERKKGDILEQRAFGLMQFAKVGLTIIIGITGLISAANVQDTPTRESLVILLAIAGALLGKLFYRGLKVVRTGTFFRPHQDTYFKPDHLDIYETQLGESYSDALKKHIARLIFYFNKTAVDNSDRVRQCKCCFVDSFGFLLAFLAFFILSIVHLLEPRLTFILPAHRMIGAGLFVLALVSDNIAEWLRLGWFQIEKEDPRF